MSNKININNLANLARIDVGGQQADKLEDSISDILDYVESVEKVAENSETDESDVGPVHNIMREDSQPHKPGVYSDQLLTEAPDTEGGNVVVPPIL
jgi:aspartyl-tRNA(Asn)/glutamyl-tRNA(Gln) amidotransferase subunit C